MIQPARVQQLNDRDIDTRGRFVMYWMQQSQRTRLNYALEYAIELANELRKPPLVVFGLMDDYPEASARHYSFMLQGLRDARDNLRKRGVHFVISRGAPHEVATKHAKHAAAVVCDRGYLRHQKRWRDQVADRAGCRVVQVESDVVVPVEVASDKPEYAARTLRPKIHRRWKEYLVELKPRDVRVRSAGLDIESDIDLSDPAAALATLRVDQSVPPTERLIGGEDQARAVFARFTKEKIRNYDEDRNEPSLAATSMMSAYLHFGHVSPVELALAARQSDVYLEELIVRRELSMNFCNFSPGYDKYESLPGWARKTLQNHARDKREQEYSLEQLERAQTHDRWWNAAQREMTGSGFMHNYMRMYWGKKILEWTKSPKEAFERTLYLNNKYFLDGRDPNSYGNVGWIFGLHDRPWGPERKIFGLVRYMNSAGLERKFDMEAYVKFVDELSAGVKQK